MQRASVDSHNSQSSHSSPVNSGNQKYDTPVMSSNTEMWCHLFNENRNKFWSYWDENTGHKQTKTSKPTTAGRSNRAVINANANVGELTSRRTCSLSLRSDTMLWDHMTKTKKSGGLGYVSKIEAL